MTCCWEFRFATTKSLVFHGASRCSGCLRTQRGQSSGSSGTGEMEAQGDPAVIKKETKESSDVKTTRDQIRTLAQASYTIPASEEMDSHVLQHAYKIKGGTVGVRASLMNSLRASAAPRAGNNAWRAEGKKLIRCDGDVV